MKKIFGAVVDYLKSTDKLLLFFCMAASALGLLVLASFHNAFYGTLRGMLVQTAATGLGLIAAIIISKIDYHFMAKMWKIHAPAAILLVLLVFFIGTGREGADDIAWIQLPFGMSFQPSELLKLSFILTFSYHLSLVRPHINSLRNVALLCVHGAIPALLIHFQGDDGTALIFIFIFVSMMFAAGLSWKYIAAAFGAVLIAAPLAWFYVMNNDQKLRILYLFHPDNPDYIKNIGWQQYLGRISIGSGQLTGKGLFADEYRKIPEMHNDFIFAFIGEVLGFLGCIAVILIFTGICVRLLRISRYSKDDLGSFICVGVFAMIVFQCVLNIGMCLNVLPVIGVTLPFLSNGGTSVLITYMAIGMALSVRVHNKPMLFD
ncbi:FtsW/RodA/SpoVE family cell cycle protein [Zongyangia hominis]|uniref:FtsW/RodA/SpoVE family cell cycle protein n=1 Tax=Zongyangia hominis TaxID=2763677 RepID=A0A926IB14_9FIRM|nr:FtsW/RodA/SpoVE family cell cycle protein [Zongyangia hominis]MBC8570766.1 FtsW/RodA/SpoVE family cell cycle protein [Zongyangia hominis]